MNKVKYLVLRDGYVESNTTTQLILSRHDLAEFNPRIAASELVECIRSMDLKRWLKLDKEDPWGRATAVDDLREAFWGNYDSTGHAFDYYPDWTDSQFPDHATECHFINERCFEWMLECWKERNPDWEETEATLRKQSARESALAKLTQAEKQALGLK